MPSGAGGLQLSINGSGFENHTFVVRLGETLLANGSVRSHMTAGCHYEERWTLTSGVNVFDMGQECLLRPLYMEHLYVEFVCKCSYVYFTYILAGEGTRNGAGQSCRGFRFRSSWLMLGPGLFTIHSMLLRHTSAELAAALKMLQLRRAACCRMERQTPSRHSPPAMTN
jgi:hypothetical protein